jgi:hypothetical protein
MKDVGAYVSLGFMIVGLAFLIIGIIYYNLNASKQASRSWWIWLLIIMGLVLTIVFAIASVFFLTTPSSKSTQSTILSTQQTTQSQLF